MAYSSGTAASFAALKTTIETVLAANGWTVSSGIISKGAAYFALVADANQLELQAGTGQSGSALTGTAAASVKVMDFTLAPITWPVTYEIHVLADPDEVYVVVQYNLDRFQHLNFGVSNVPGIGGSGAWFTGSFRGNVPRTSSNCRVFLRNGNGSGTDVGAQPFDGFGLGFFFSGIDGSFQSSFLHCGLEGVGWKTVYGSAAGNLLGPSYTSALLYALPSLFNQATPLLPIHALVARASQGQTIAASLAHARYCRLDHVVAGEVLTYGSDDWKVYPLHSRNDAQRDGVTWITGAQHSGTFGVAIRYTGP